MKLSFTKYAAIALLPLSVVSAPAFAGDHAAHSAPAATYAPITEDEVHAAQKGWGDALVAIAVEYDTKGVAAAKTLAGTVLDSAYAYNMGPVLFKPTLTHGDQTFRMTREGALAYFVGDDAKFPNDKGFALKGWRSVSVDTKEIIISGNTAISMGNVTMTDSKGNKTTVDKTWAYVRDGEGKLRIVLHHSSLPYSPK